MTVTGDLKIPSGTITGNVKINDIVDVAATTLTSYNANASAFAGCFTDGVFVYYVPSSAGIVARVPIDDYTEEMVEHLDLTYGDSTAKQFRFGVTDGTYGYLCGYYSGSGTAYLSLLVRFELDDFTVNSLTYLDLSLSSGGTNAKGYYGICTDGRYIYQAPHYNGTSYHGLVARIDTQNFDNTGVTFLDVAATLGTNYVGFVGCFVGGKHIYFVPHRHATNYHGYIVRVDIATFSVIESLDLTAVTGGTNAKGYFGGFSDGVYAYFVPYRNSTSNNTCHGLFARVDMNNFTTSGVTFLNLQSVNTNLKGYCGACFDGKYAYLAPNTLQNSGLVYSGYFTRVEIANFTPGGVTYYNLQDINQEYQAFIGTVLNNDMVYLAPNGFGKVAPRIKTTDFSSSGVTYNKVDLSRNRSVYTTSRGYTGGFTDGLYGYLVPANCVYNSATQYHGNVARIDLSDRTNNTLKFLNLTYGGNSNAEGYFGGFTDGRYGYFVPDKNAAGSHGLISRVDLNDFSPSGISYVNLAEVNPSAVGYRGGFTDGKYGYFIPYINGTTPHGLLARVDLFDFTSNGVSFLNLVEVNSNLKGFVGGFYDGRYGYAIPYQNHNSNNSNHGLFTRIDTYNFTKAGVTVLDLTSNTLGYGSNLVGFFGGFNSGKYGYLVQKCAYGSNVGKVVRVDLSTFNYNDLSVINLQNLNSNARGFSGAFTDDLYAYLVPLSNSAATGVAAKIDLNNFVENSNNVTFLDLSTRNTNLKGFMGGFTNKSYGVYVPYFSGGSTYTSYAAIVNMNDFSKVGTTALDVSRSTGSRLNFNNKVEFKKDVTMSGKMYSWYESRMQKTIIGATTTDVISGDTMLTVIGDVKLNGKITSDFNVNDILQTTSISLSNIDTNSSRFLGAFTDGDYVYYSPNANGFVARVPTDNFCENEVETLNIYYGNSNAKVYYNGLVLGSYGYLCPQEDGGGNASGLVVRFSTTNFTTEGVSYLDLTLLNANAKAYNGVCTDGRYLYLSPGINYNNSYSNSIAARIDTYNFTTSGVTFCDLAAASGNTAARGFRGCVCQNGYIYFSPGKLNSTTMNSIAARVDTTTFSSVTLLNLTTAAGGTNALGYRGQFTDGRYLYFVPYANTNTTWHGLVARVDLDNFTSAGVTFLDLTTVNANLKGFIDGYTDGRYGYLIPCQLSSTASHGNVVRIDLANFTTSGVTYYNLESLDTTLQGFRGGCLFKNYLYLAPYAYNKAIKINTKTFSSTSISYEALNLTKNGGHDIESGFVGAFTDGRYGYFVPNITYLPTTGTTKTHGVVARLDLGDRTNNAMTYLNLTQGGRTDAVGCEYGFSDGTYAYFISTNSGSNGLVVRVDVENFTPTGISYLDVTQANASAKGFKGGFTDGRYGYLVPYGNSNNGLFTRFTLSNFTTAGVSFLDIASTNASAVGFHQGFCSGKYGYLVPNTNQSGAHGFFTRVNLQDFSTVDILDLTTVAANLKGFTGGFALNNYAYLVPTRTSTTTYHGNVARISLSNFAISEVSYLDVSLSNSFAIGFSEGFTDGRYGYLVPFQNSSTPTYHGVLTRFDTYNFTLSGTSYMDLSLANSNLKGFRGGFTDGEFGYLSPNTIANNTYTSQAAIFNLADFNIGSVWRVDLNIATPTTLSIYKPLKAMNDTTVGGTLTVKRDANIQGDLNFSGILKQNGAAYIGSQWSNNGNLVFINGSNVSIDGNVSVSDKRYLQVGHLYRVSEYNNSPSVRWWKLGVIGSNVNEQYLYMNNLNGSRVDNASCYPFIHFSPRAYGTPRFNFSKFGANNFSTHVNIYYNNVNANFEAWVKSDSFTYFKGDIYFNGSSLDLVPTSNNTWTTTVPEVGNANLVFQYSTASNPPIQYMHTNAGYLGIQTTSAPAYPLDVQGDVNFTGTLRQNGSPFQTSAFTSTTNGIYVMSNIGVQAVANSSNALTINGNTSVTGHIYPSANVTYDLGTSAYRFRDLYLSGSTIYLGGARFQADANSNITVTTPFSVASNLNVTGNFGIRGLEVRKNNGTAANLVTSVTTIPGFSNTSTGLQLSIDSNLSTYQYKFLAGTGGTELARLTGDGKLGIGTSSPSNILHLASNAPSAKATLLSLQNTGSGNLLAEAAIQFKTYQTSYPQVEISCVDSNYTGELVIRSKIANADTNGLIERLRIQGNGNIIMMSNITHSNTMSNLGHAYFGSNITVNSNIVVNSRIGVANPNPSYPLDVTGDINFTGTLRQNGTSFGGGVGWAANGTYIYSMSNIAIGKNTVNTNNVLDIYSTTANASYIGIAGNGGANSCGIRFAPYESRVASYGYANLIYSTDDGAASGHLIFSTANGATATAAERMRITSAGSVGINNTNPSSSYKLDVGGDINCTGSFRVNGVALTTSSSLTFYSIDIPTNQSYTADGQITTLNYSAFGGTAVSINGYTGKQLGTTGIYLLNDNNSIYNSSANDVMILISNKSQYDGAVADGQRWLRLYSTRTSGSFNYSVYTKWWHGQPTYVCVPGSGRIQFGITASDNGLSYPFNVYGGTLKVAYVQTI
jgi:hypothetical protein